MSYKRIQLKGTGRIEEGVAGGPIKPGHLVALNSSSQYVVHAFAGTATPRVFAVEDALQGKTIDDVYAAGSRVSLLFAQPGDVVYAWLNAGENVVVGDKLASAGDGTLAKVAGGAVPLAVALESLDLQDSASEDTRIAVLVF